MMSPSLCEDHKEEYFSKKPSYYKRSNILSSSSATFQEKYRKNFGRPTLSSYTSLDEEEKREETLSSWEQNFPKSANTSPIPPFSRKRMFPKRSSTVPTASKSVISPYADQIVNSSEEEENNYDYEDEDSTENAFLNQHNKPFSRQNTSKFSTSWRSSVWRAIRVKSR